MRKGIITSTVCLSTATAAADTPPSTISLAVAPMSGCFMALSFDHPQGNRSDHPVDKVVIPFRFVVQVAIGGLVPPDSEVIGEVVRSPLADEGLLAPSPHRASRMEVADALQLPSELTLGDFVRTNQLDSVVEDAVLHFLSFLWSSLYLSLSGSNREP